MRRNKLAPHGTAAILNFFLNACWSIVWLLHSLLRFLLRLALGERNGATGRGE